MSKMRVVLMLFLLCLVALPAGARKSQQGSMVAGMVEAMAPARGSFPSHLQGCPKVQISLQAAGDASGAQPPPYIAVTDNIGHYVIENVPAGRYVLTASRPGVGSATTQVVVGSNVPYVTQNLVLAPSGPPPVAGPTPAPMLSTGAPVVSGQVFVALAPTQSTSMLSSAPGTAPTANPHSFGKNIPGPPAMNMGAITALMYNGGDPYLLSTGQKRPDAFEAFKEGHTVIQSSNTRLSIMRMNANSVGSVQYATALQANPYWLALNASGSELFVANDQQGIDIYDTGTAGTVGHIQAGGVVTDLVLSPDGNWIFAPLAAGVTGIMVINPNTNQAVRFIPTPRLSSGTGSPTSVAVSPDSRRIYVSISSAKAGEVVCIDTVTKQVIGRCAVGGQPLGVALTPDGRLLFCANNSSANVSVIDVAGMREIGRIHVGIGPCRIAIKPDGTKAYVTCKGSNEVAVISSAASLARTIPVGNGPTGIAVTPDGRKVFVSNTAGGSVSVIDTDRDVMENTTSSQLLSRPYGVVIARNR